MSLRSKALLGSIAGVIAFGLASCDSSGNTGERSDATKTEITEARAPIGRLPALAKPTYYKLDMRVDPREEGFSGTALIDVSLEKASNGFWLHGKDLAVSKVEVTAGGETFVAGWEEKLATGVARIDFGRDLPAGDIKVAIEYSAKFDALLRGLFRVEEQGDAYALAKSESIQARRFLPGFDEPGYKNVFDISLTIPESYEAISNAPELSKTPADNGFIKVQFDKTRPLPTYLLSIAVGPFDIVDYAPLPPNEVRSEPIPLRGVARRGRGADLEYALSVTDDLIEIFETELKVPYPYKKLDIVAAPQWPSGATELAGAISYRESRILYNEALGEGARRSLLGIHTHEIAHMWFGDLVTPPWWDDLWLKESFATWGTPISLIEFEPQGGHDLDALSSAQRAMGLDSIDSARAIREPIDRNENIRNAYDGITYSKGMAVIRMIDSYFGPDVFRPALGEYVVRFEDGVADANQFFEVIGEVSGEPAITEIFQSFVTQSGLPVIDTELNCAEGTSPSVKVTQSQYSPLGSAIEQGKSWALPVCIRYSNADGTSGSSCQIVREETASIALDTGSCPAWIMPNTNATGYYRWDLSGDQWSALASNLDQLSAAESLSTIDNALAAFRAGGGDAAGLLDLLEAAASSEDLNIATAPMRAFGGLEKLVEGSDEARTAFNAYAMNLYGGIYADLTGSSATENSLFATEISKFLATIAEEPTLRSELSEKAAQYIGFAGRQRRDTLPSDLYGTAFDIAVQTQGPEFFEALSQAREEIDNPRFAASAASALGSATDEESVGKIRAMILDGRLGPRETYALLQQQLDNEETRDATWTWLQENYATFVGNIPGTWPRRTPRLAGVFCDAGKVDELTALFDQYGDLAEGHERALAETIEALQLCDAFRSDRSEEFRAALMAR